MIAEPVDVKIRIVGMRTLYGLIWIQYCRKYQIIPKRNERKPVTDGPSSSMDVTRSIQIKLFK